MNQATQFLREAYAELRQSTWLTRQQAIDSTKVVVFIVAIMSVYVSLVDWFLAILVRAVLGH